MLKFVVLSVLALGCSAVSHISYSSQPLDSRHGGFSSFGHGYNHGSGYGSRVFSLGHGDKKVSFGSFGYGLGGGLNTHGISHHGFGGYGLGGGFGGLRYTTMPANYRVGNTAAIQYVMQPTAYYTTAAAQPLIIGYQGAHINQGLKFHHESRPLLSHVNFLTQHQTEAHQEVVPAAVQQLPRTVEYKTLPYQEQPMRPQVVEVEPSEIPLHLHFKTKSSSVSLSQSHESAQAQETQVSQSQDEPARLIHEIQKPIIQEVREVITPYRQVTQEINPVVEAVHTVVTKAEGQRQKFLKTEYQPVQNVAHEQRVSAQPVAAVQIAAAPAVEQRFIAQPIQAVEHVAVAAQPIQTVEHVAVAAQPITYGYQFAQPVIADAGLAIESGKTAFITGIPSGISGYNFEAGKIGHESGKISGFGSGKIGSFESGKISGFESGKISGFESGKFGSFESGKIGAENHGQSHLVSSHSIRSGEQRSY